MNERAYSGHESQLFGVEEYRLAGGKGDGEGTFYSGTNVQVAGVDEGDIVKTDGTYIYILRGS